MSNILLNSDVVPPSAFFTFWMHIVLLFHLHRCTVSWSFESYVQINSILWGHEFNQHCSLWLPHPPLPPCFQVLCCPSWQLASSTSDSAWGWDKLKQFLKGICTVTWEKDRKYHKAYNPNKIRIEEMDNPLVKTDFHCLKKLFMHHAGTLVECNGSNCSAAGTGGRQWRSWAWSGNQMDSWMALQLLHLN